MIIRFRHKGLRQLYEIGDRLKGDRVGYWAVTVSRNWRVVFRFEGGDATDVDLIDYHQDLERAGEHAHDRPTPSRSIRTIRLP